MKELATQARSPDLIPWDPSKGRCRESSSTVYSSIWGAGLCVVVFLLSEAQPHLAQTGLKLPVC